MYRSAWDTWKEYVESFIPDGRPGAVVSLHTSGSLLEFNPHLHCLALNGAVKEDGSFEQLPEIDTELLAEFFSESVFDHLLKADLIDEEIVRNMKSWQHSGFHFYAGDEIAGDDDDARRYLGRYLKKPSLVSARIEIDESGNDPQVVYRHEANYDGEFTERVATFTPLEFLAQLSLHVPRIYESTVRYFGEYSPGARGKKRKEQEWQKVVQNNFEPPKHEPEPKKPSGTWQKCIKLVYEVDPLTCPKCGEHMYIKSFITNSKEIKRIAKSKGLSPWRAPPGLKSSNADVQVDTSEEYCQT